MKMQINKTKITGLTPSKKQILKSLQGAVSSPIDFNKIRDAQKQEELYVASECIYDDDGVHYVCSKCGKYHNTDWDAVMCCLIDESREFISEFNSNKVSDEFLQSCAKAARLFGKNP